MAVSAFDLRDMAREMLASARSDPANWMELMGMVAPFYKYDFESAVLIAAQRPDAVACATMQQWNRHNLWIRKGSKAIHVLDPKNPYYVQRVFDISDVNARPERLPAIWQLREEDQTQVFERINPEWAQDDQGNDAGMMLYELILEAVTELAADHRNDFEDARSVSGISEMPPEDAESIFSGLVANSAYCIAAQRLNIDLPAEFTAEIFEDIQHFDTFDMQLAIGNAAHASAESVLRRIEREVRILAAERNMRDNTGEERNETPTEERMVEYGDQESRDSVQRGGGRNAASDPELPEAAGGQRGQVRRNAQSVSGEVPQSDLRTDASERNAQEAPDRSERTGARDAGADDSEPAEERSRTGQGGGSAGLDPAHEQPESTGGGDRPERTDLRLTEESKQISFEELSESPGSFSMPSEGQLTLFSAIPVNMPQEIVDRVLADGSNNRESALRIVARFKRDLPVEQNSEFLQREYGKGGKGMVLGGRNVSVFWDADGIRIAYGRASRYERVQTVSWLQAARRIREMLDAGLYMPNGNLDTVDYNERRELAVQLWNFYRDTLGLPDEWNLKGGYPEEVQKITKQLEDPVQREQIAVRFFADAETVALGENPRYIWRNMNLLKENMTAFLRPRLTFTATEPVQPPEKRFITQDEIDLELSDGGRVAGSRDRIFRYYQESRTLKERITFLKNEYGIGGHSHAMGGADNAWEDHDGKGIKLTRGGLANPYDQVLLKWDKVAKRIGELIAAGRYLTQDEYQMLHPEEHEAVEVPAKEYELGFGSLGNGTTVWNRLEEEHGDYKTVAHISDDGIVSIRDANMPPEVAERIHAFAEKQRILAQTMPSRDQWIEDMTAEYGDRIVQRVNQEAAQQDAAQLDEAIGRITSEVLQEDADVHQVYVDDERFRSSLAEHIASRIDFVPRGTKSQTPVDEPEEPALEPDDSPEVIRAIHAYQQYKQDYPQHIVLVRVNDRYETYGEDAQKAQPILSSNMFERIAPDGTALAVTGFDRAENWYSHMHSIWKKGQSILLADINDRGEYEILAEHEGKDYVPIGAELMLDGHKFRVDSVNHDNERVSLQDLTMFESGYPLFRSEPIDWVHEQLEEQPLEEVKLNSIVIDLVPRGTKSEPAGNYRIHDDTLGIGGAKTKADRNIEAIRMLQTLEAEERGASAEEQETLAQYVGWGGIPQIFDESNEAWKTRRDELRALLTDAEYASARASTLNAHYTSPTVIRAMYQALENMGFNEGRILEPSCGVGNFFGMLTDRMYESRLYGVELDSITGRIAQKLYPNAQIAVQGYEHTAFPDNYFDVAVGNVPFGAYSLPDTRYDKHHFRIHDYFFAKTLDKVRSGGVIAFITSKGTMDKLDSSVRRYIAQRAELLGAIRLPNNAFLANAGTGVTSDILFLQKRERQIDIAPDWVDVGKNDDGIPVNRYFLDHPEMMLGTMAFEKSMYGNDRETTCQPVPDANLADQLAEAVKHIGGRYEKAVVQEAAQENGNIPADPTVPNFSFAVRDGKVYYRRDQWMEPCAFSQNDDQRVRSMIALRDLTRELIQSQLAGAADSVVGSLQMELRERYEAFSSRFGLLSDRRNAQVFREDDGYYLLTSLEILDEEHKLLRLADMFSKRTIIQNKAIDHVENAAEALAVSMAERAKIDLVYMSDLTGLDKDKLISELKGLIFQNPYGNPGPYEKWETADEYLSGDVRQKLKAADAAVQFLGDRFQVNVDALRAVQPKDLEPHEIDVRLGATWIPASDVTDFMHELLRTPRYMREKIQVEYAPSTGSWHVSAKSLDHSNDRANTQYGTSRRSAYKIIEESLNLRDVRVFDTVFDADGNEKRVLNQKQTILAQQKQTAIREAFHDWIWKDPARRERLGRLYNDTYNCIRPREYDGSHLRFIGMNPELKLRPHQRNAVARILYGGNTLLAHTVGAGKTAVMISSIIEKKRIGLGHKALLAVPNHLTEQTAAEFLRFYPGAKILVATKRDFEKQNRKRFIGRIATGDYDAIIMGHSQFEKIPVSKERQKMMLEEQIQEIMDGIEEVKENNGERFTIKEMERARKSLEARLKRLNSDEDKDAVVTFEELGVDMLYVDEAHMFKNLAVITKMRNVAGINTLEAKKSSDMYMKTRYLSELTGNHGVVFATGTPISNSMTELYTMQRYLQQPELARRGLAHFDSWAATFGETQTAIELAPEGTGYRLKTRFAKFYNLPELMSFFKMVADVQTPDMLNLPVPKLRGGATQNVKTQASEYQKRMVAELGERAEAVRKGMVDPREDNMLRITNDGRLLALDARLIDPELPDDPDSKVNACVREILRIHEEGTPERLTQLIFCDLSTPKVERTDGGFDDVYHDIRRKLIRGGVPENEIAFIHDATTEAKKDELFAKVRSGAVRILIGSTAKMGAGTNVQTKLKALHHIDCPWRPSDLQQRDGRIVRQGNTNREVEVIRYITQDTFDSYSYQLVENKQKFVAQIFTSKSPARGAEDMDEMALSYAEVKALATGNPAIREKMNLDVEVTKLKLLKSNWQSERYYLERRVSTELPAEIAHLEHRIHQQETDIQTYQQNKPSAEDGFSITLMGRTFDKRAEAGEQLMNLVSLVQGEESMKAGTFCGFEVRISKSAMLLNPKIELHGECSYSAEMGSSGLGNITRLENLAEGIADVRDKDDASLQTARAQLESGKEELGKPWPQEEELQQKSARLTELNLELDVGGHDTSAAALAEDDDEPQHAKESRRKEAER